MNVLFYSTDASVLSLAQYAQQVEHHNVVVHITDERYRDVGKGLVFLTDDPNSIASQADLVVFGDNGKGHVADRWRSQGLAVWNGGAWADRLEYDRLYGMKVFAEHGINIPDTYEVSTTSEVEACLKSYFRPRDRVVVKISGTEGAGTSFSYVAKNSEDLVSQVNHWEEEGKLPAKWSGIVQEFINGIEVSVEAWWNGSEFSTHNITIEEKKCWPGDLGPSVGCAFNTVASIYDDSRLFKMMLDPLGEFMKDSGYTGQIDVNSIVDEASGLPYALEFTPRPGFEATPTLAWGNDKGYVNKIALVLGLDTEIKEQFGYRGKFLGGVRVHVPPYPLEVKNEDLESKTTEKVCKGVPFENFQDVCDSFLLYDAACEDDRIVCAGSSGILGVALGAGDSPDEAGKAAYAVATRCQIPNKAYRALDGYKRASRDIPDLVASGLVKIFEP